MFDLDIPFKVSHILKTIGHYILIGKREMIVGGFALSPLCVHTASATGLQL